ncbi:hypothetical protein JCM21900_002702 [Sporobolomyces salmonicolor]
MSRCSISSTSSSDEPQTPLSPYLAGTPLERIRTRTSSSSSLSPPLPPNCPPGPFPPSSRSAAHPCPRRPPSSSSRQPLYSDAFCTLTSSTLTVRRILHRTSMTLPLSSIRSSRPFCTPAERYALLHGGARLRLTGVRTGGVGWTGITWARDADRVVEERWTCAVVLKVDGWVGRVGFSVDDPDAWWSAWEEARKGPGAAVVCSGVSAGDV